MALKAMPIPFRLCGMGGRLPIRAHVMNGPYRDSDGTNTFSHYHHAKKSRTATAVRLKFK